MKVIKKGTNLLDGVKDKNAKTQYVNFYNQLEIELQHYRTKNKVLSNGNSNNDKGKKEIVL